ncbi:adenylyltransferase/sulfurtransferase [Halospina denitrificans]|uniref:Molybdopterin-synthase adenylyltransferase n=1 Tax=Halospina denitrificans TaxID=332522 RepID=A0A4V3EPN5_9GAMM|nr:molybdopterin-synthase adenylyltransferase MoeB [Halospina denitrificans]TDT38458.1 adenylyltransferase/sulfurtransferase [Halospina denitrificans]
MSPLTDDDLQRYSRQILMPEFDIAGQQALADSRILVVGAGGLGCPVVLYLAGAGVGHIHVIDDDRVELANLQRQIAFTMDDLDHPKATALANRARALNPGANVTAETARADPQWLGLNLGEYDLVLDATDNFNTRFAINQASVASGVPLVSGAAIRAEGQIAVFDPRDKNSPCYQCLYADVGEATLSCSETGVLGPLVGMIGTTQAMEAIKLLANVGAPLTGRLLILDAWRMHWREMKIPPDPQCKVCGNS